MGGVSNRPVARLTPVGRHLVYLLKEPLEGFGDAPPANLFGQDAGTSGRGIIVVVRRNLIPEQNVDDIGLLACKRTAASCAWAARLWLRAHGDAPEWLDGHLGQNRAPK
jgi:hypothetical protein